MPETPLPNTLVMSPDEPVLVFSSSMFASDTAPTSHPARVKGTHGAGVFFWPVVTMFGSLSGNPTGSVQYLNALEKPVELGFPVKNWYELPTLMPLRSG